MGTDSGCVHDCRHPLWGGAGTCQYHADSAVCACDPGYSTRDALGHASCVPQRVLATGFFVLSMVSIMAAAHVLKHIYQFRHLPTVAKSSRKTVIRIRALLSASVYLIGFGCIGMALAARAGTAGYAEDGVEQVIYIVLLPSMMFGVAMIAEFWVETLPSQLLPPNSLAGMLRKVSENSGVFVLVGAANASPISVIGVLTLFFEDWPQKTSEIVTTAATLTTMAVILFVAFRITRVIDQALVKPGYFSKLEGIYVKAKKSLWLQASALCGIGFLAVSVTAIKRLTLAGRSTPIILGTLQVLTAHAAAVIFASATKFDIPPASTCNSYAVASSEVWSPRSSAATALSGATSAMNRLLWKQQEMIPEEDTTQSDGQFRPKGDDANRLRQESKTISFRRVKPEAMDNRASRHLRNSVLPIDEQTGAFGTCNTNADSWTVSSLADVEEQKDLEEE